VVGDTGFDPDKNYYAWSAPKQIEAGATAEITLFQKIPNGGSPPSKPSFTYNFLSSEVNFNGNNGGWSLSNFEDILNGEKIYSSTALFSSYQGDSNATAIGTTDIDSGWSIPVLTQKRKDGVATTYRGIWNDLPTGTEFNGSDFRGDVVKYKTGDIVGGIENVEYYICVETHTKDSILPPNSNKWQYFGSIFDSFATGVLISEKSFVGDELQIGEDGLGGVLRSPAFKGGIFDADSKQPINDSDDYTIAGYLLATDSANNVFFDVGGINPHTEDLSFIRYSSLTGKVEIKGTFINNSVESTVVSSGSSINQSLEEYINSLQGTQDFDNIAYFVGGGYNNTFNNTGYEADNIASSIVGGAQNLMSSHFSSIVGGYENQCRDNFSVIGGGWINTMSAIEEGNRQGANGILSGINNNINGGSNQTIINGVDNKIEQTSIGDQNAGEGGVKLDIINAITGPRYFGIPGGNHAVFSAESDSWIYSSWFPGYGINNFSDYFFITSPTHENQWIFSTEFGWTYISWKTPTSMKTYLPEGSDISLSLWTDWEDGLGGWWIITKPVSTTFLEHTPSYVLMWKDGVGWYFVRRTADDKTQAWQSSGTTAWAIGVAYNVGDLVHYGGYRWRCESNHTSTSSNYPRTGSSIWTNIGLSWQTAVSSY
ncbi:MAG: hypothetical protein EBY39_12035, partial [Flavobacteriia bacterium]|nr:hypothetical protein [Flavobacteriia bacterium]